MRILHALVIALSLLATSCGGGTDGPESAVIVHGMGWDGETLGFAQPAYSKKFVVRLFISHVLQADTDEDRPVRVVMHELMHDLHIRYGGPHPHSRPPTWYSADGDHKDPYAPIPADEVAWLKTHEVQEIWVYEVYNPTEDDLYAPDQNPDPIDAAMWLQPWTEAACERINDAVGQELFVFMGVVEHD